MSSRLRYTNHRDSQESGSMHYFLVFFLFESVAFPSLSTFRSSLERLVTQGLSVGLLQISSPSWHSHAAASNRTGVLLPPGLPKRTCTSYIHSPLDPGKRGFSVRKVWSTSYGDGKRKLSSAGSLGRKLSGTRWADLQDGRD